MNENKEQARRRRRWMILPLLILVGLCALLVWAGLHEQLESLLFKVLVCVAMLAIWALVDLLIPKVCGELDGHTGPQMAAYRIYLLMDLAGYAGLAYFLISANNQKGYYGALLFVVMLFLKKRYYNEFMGLNPDGTKPETEDTASAGIARSTGEVKEEPDAASGQEPQDLPQLDLDEDDEA